MQRETYPGQWAELSARVGRAVVLVTQLCPKPSSGPACLCLEDPFTTLKPRLRIRQSSRCNNVVNY